ncbi:MAG: hypothetical protein FWB76_04370 [Oscillospiraceae bacterium]|nr:hypothetical protein [Oscillospiraceae bacterium]
MKKLLVIALLLALVLAACTVPGRQPVVLEQPPAEFDLAELMQMDLSPYITLGQYLGVAVEIDDGSFAWHENRRRSFRAAFENANIHDLPDWIAQARESFGFVPWWYSYYMEFDEDPLYRQWNMEEDLQYRTLLFILAVAQQEHFSITATDEEFIAWQTENWIRFSEHEEVRQWEIDEVGGGEGFRANNDIHAFLVSFVQTLIVEHAVPL